MFMSVDFSGPGRTHDGTEFPGRDFQGHPVERNGFRAPVAIPL